MVNPPFSDTEIIPGPFQLGWVIPNDVITVARNKSPEYSQWDHNPFIGGAVEDITMVINPQLNPYKLGLYIHL